MCGISVEVKSTNVKRLFRWSVSEELIPTDVYDALRTVDGLKRGRSAARESEAITRVSAVDVEALLPFLTPPVAAMVQLQQCTGMRPGEVVKMKAAAIDMTGDVWTYDLDEHKTDWRGQERIVGLGPRAQQMLQPFLDRPRSVFLFSPRESLAWQLERRKICFKKTRKTPIYPSERLLIVSRKI
jgi:site-specific recombinase XerD